MNQAVTTPCNMKTVIDSSPVGKYFEVSESGFVYVPSMRAFELYVSMHPMLHKFQIHVGTFGSCDTTIRLTNETYCITRESVESVEDEFKETLQGLATAVKNKKLEGLEVGEGNLIFQDRRPVEIAELEGGKIQLYWRGKLDRIPPEYNAVTLSLI